MKHVPDNHVALGAWPGLCGHCAHARINETRRGRAVWDERLVRYPRLPVRECVGFDRTAG